MRIATPTWVKPPYSSVSNHEGRYFYMKTRCSKSPAFELLYYPKNNIILSTRVTKQNIMPQVYDYYTTRNVNVRYGVMIEFLDLPVILNLIQDLMF